MIATVFAAVTTELPVRSVGPGYCYLAISEDGVSNTGSSVSIFFNDMNRVANKDLKVTFAFDDVFDVTLSGSEFACNYSKTVNGVELEGNISSTWDSSDETLTVDLKEAHADIGDSLLKVKCVGSTVERGTNTRNTVLAWINDASMTGPYARECLVSPSDTYHLPSADVAAPVAVYYATANADEYVVSAFFTDINPATYTDAVVVDGTTAAALMELTGVASYTAAVGTAAKYVYVRATVTLAAGSVPTSGVFYGVTVPIVKSSELAVQQVMKPFVSQCADVTKCMSWAPVYPPAGKFAIVNQYYNIEFDPATPIAVANNAYADYTYNVELETELTITSTSGTSLEGAECRFVQDEFASTDMLGGTGASDRVITVKANKVEVFVKRNAPLLLTCVVGYAGVVEPKFALAATFKYPGAELVIVVPDTAVDVVATSAAIVFPLKPVAFDETVTAEIFVPTSVLDISGNGKLIAESLFGTPTCSKFRIGSRVLDYASVAVSGTDVLLSIKLWQEQSASNQGMLHITCDSGIPAITDLTVTDAFLSLPGYEISTGVFADPVPFFNIITAGGVSGLPLKATLMKRSNDMFAEDAQSFALPILVQGANIVGDFDVTYTVNFPKALDNVARKCVFVAADATDADVKTALDALAVTYTGAIVETVAVTGNGDAEYTEGAALVVRCDFPEGFPDAFFAAPAVERQFQLFSQRNKFDGTVYSQTGVIAAGDFYFGSNLVTASMNIVLVQQTSVSGAFAYELAAEIANANVVLDKDTEFNLYLPYFFNSAVSPICTVSLDNGAAQPTLATVFQVKEKLPMVSFKINAGNTVYPDTTKVAVACKNIGAPEHDVIQQVTRIEIVSGSTAFRTDRVPVGKLPKSLAYSAANWYANGAVADSIDFSKFDYLQLVPTVSFADAAGKAIASNTYAEKSVLYNVKPVGFSGSATRTLSLAYEGTEVIRFFPTTATYTATEGCPAWTNAGNAEIAVTVSLDGKTRILSCKAAGNTVEPATDIAQTCVNGLWQRDADLSLATTLPTCVPASFTGEAFIGDVKASTFTTAAPYKATVGQAFTIVVEGTIPAADITDITFSDTTCSGSFAGTASVDVTCSKSSPLVKAYVIANNAGLSVVINIVVQSVVVVTNDLDTPVDFQLTEFAWTSIFAYGAFPVRAFAEESVSFDRTVAISATASPACTFSTTQLLIPAGSKSSNIITVTCPNKPIFKFVDQTAQFSVAIGTIVQPAFQVSCNPAGLQVINGNTDAAIAGAVTGFWDRTSVAAQVFYPKCSATFQSVVPNQLVCEVDGEDATWVSTRVACVETVCANTTLPTVANAAWVEVAGAFPMQYKLECADNFVFATTADPVNYAPVATCMKNKGWSVPDHYACVPATCGVFAPILNGFVAYDELSEDVGGNSNGIFYADVNATSTSIAAVSAGVTATLRCADGFLPKQYLASAECSMNADTGAYWKIGEDEITAFECVPSPTCAAPASVLPTGIVWDSDVYQAGEELTFSGCADGEFAFTDYTCAVTPAQAAACNSAAGPCTFTATGSYAVCLTPAVATCQELGSAAIQAYEAEVGVRKLSVSPVGMKLGDFAGVACEYGYDADSAAGLQCSYDAVSNTFSWVRVGGATPFCKKTGCSIKDLKLSNGVELVFESGDDLGMMKETRDYDLVANGGLATYMCAENFQVLGYTGTKCADGAWVSTAEHVRCVQTTCTAFDGDVTNVDVVASGVESFIANVVAAIDDFPTSNELFCAEGMGFSKPKYAKCVLNAGTGLASWVTSHNEACTPNACDYTLITSRVGTAFYGEVTNLGSPKDINVANTKAVVGTSIQVQCVAPDGVSEMEFRGTGSDVITLTCDGTILNTDVALGGWSELPLCVYKTCAVGEDVFDSENTAQLVPEAAGTTINVGEAIAWTCDTDYLPSPRKSVCSTTGLSSAPSCVYSKCMAPEGLVVGENGVEDFVSVETGVTFTGYVGDVATVKCAEGYVIAEGTSFVYECAANATLAPEYAGQYVPYNGGAPAVCEPIKCMAPAYAVSGQNTFYAPGEENINFGQVFCGDDDAHLVRIATHKYINSHELQVTCLADGTFNIDVSQYTCVYDVDQCVDPTLPVEDGGVALNEKLGAYDSVTAAYRDDINGGVDVYTADSNFQFKCSNPESVAINLGLFRCTRRYDVDTGAVSMKWVEEVSNDNARCVFPGCGVFEAPANNANVDVTYVDVDGADHNVVARVQCLNDGAILGVDAEYVCNSDRKWVSVATGAVATEATFANACSASKACPAFDPIAEFEGADPLGFTLGGIVVSEFAAQPLGTVVDVFCRIPGQHLVGPNQITCLEGNQWSAVPKCVNLCPAPADTVSEQFVLNTPVLTAANGDAFYAAGTTAQVICKPGFSATTHVSVSNCQPNGQWELYDQCTLDVELSSTVNAEDAFGVLGFNIFLEHGALGVTKALLTPSNEVCYEIFEGLTASRLGSAAMCSVNTNGIRVRMSPDHVIAAEDFLYTRNSTLFPASAGAAGSVDGPFLPLRRLTIQSTVAPHSTLTSTAFVTIGCSGFTLASSFTDLSGKALEYKFEVTGGSNGALVNAVQALIDEQAPVASRKIFTATSSAQPVSVINVPAVVATSVFDQNNLEVQIRVTATNWYGNTDEQTFVVTRDMNAPKIIVAASEFTIRTGDEITLVGYGEASCVPGAVITTEWRVEDSSATGGYRVISEGTTAVVAPTADTRYRFYVTQTNPSEASTTVFAPVTVHVGDAEIISIIDGKHSGVQPANFDPAVLPGAADASPVTVFFHNVFDRSQALVLDGSKSFATTLNQPELKYSWNCRMNINYTAPEITQNQPYIGSAMEWADCNVRQYSLQFTGQGPVLSVANSDIAQLFDRKPTLFLKFQLVVETESEFFAEPTDTTEVVIRVIDNESQYRVSYITGANTNVELIDDEDVNAVYLQRAGAQKGYVHSGPADLTLTARITASDSNYATFWHCDNLDLSKFAATPVENTSTLTIKSAGLVPGYNYECKLSILGQQSAIPNDRAAIFYDGRLNNYEYINIYVNMAPTVPKCTYSSDDSILSCSSFDADGYVYGYRYAIANAASSSSVIFSGVTGPSIFLPLPAGNYVVEITAFDNLGAKSSSRVEINELSSDIDVATIVAAAKNAPVTTETFVQNALVAAAALSTDTSVEAAAFREALLGKMADAAANNLSAGSASMLNVATALLTGETAASTPALRQSALAVIAGNLRGLSVSGTVKSEAADAAIKGFGSIVLDAGAAANVVEVSAVLGSFAKQLPYIVQHALAGKTSTSGPVTVSAGGVTVTAERLTLAAAQAKYATGAVAISADFFQVLASRGLEIIDAAEVKVTDTAFLARVGTDAEISAISQLQGLSFFDGVSAIDTSSITEVLVTVPHPATLRSSAHKFVTCQFFDEETGVSATPTERGAWGTAGCRVHATSARETICKCTHLTMFRARAGYSGYTMNGWLDLTRANIDDTPQPVYMILVWAGVAVILIAFAAVRDSTKKVEGIKLLVEQWTSGDVPKHGKQPIQNAHCTNAGVKTGALINEYHMFFSAFTRSPLSNIGGATRMFVATLVFLTGFAANAMFWGGKESRGDISNYGGVIFLSALVMVVASLVLHFVVSKTRSYGLKTFIYTYAFELAQLYNTGSSEYFSAAEQATLKNRADPAQTAAYAQAINAAIIGNEAELHALLRQSIVIDQAHAIKTYESKGAEVNVGSIFSYGFLIAWAFGMFIIICAFGIQLGNTVSTSFEKWIGSSFATLFIEMLAVKPFLFYVYSLFAVTCTANPSEVGALSAESVLTAYERLKGYVPPQSAAEAGEEATAEAVVEATEVPVAEVAAPEEPTATA